MDEVSQANNFEFVDFLARRTWILRNVNRSQNRRVAKITLFGKFHFIGLFIVICLGDPCQLKARFGDFKFITDESIASTGLDLAPLTLFMKCRVPSAVLNFCRRGSETLFRFVNDYF